MKKTSVEIKSRPVKFAYLVPNEDSKKNNLILDAVFKECYSRWGGFTTLVVPCNRTSFAHNDYAAWLKAFDPDFLYTYVDLEESFLRIINKIVSPVKFLKHEYENDSQDIRSFYPRNNYIRNISSLSTIFSPRSDYRPTYFSERSERILLTQFEIDDRERFISDNFGTQHDLSAYTNPIQDAFDTYCFLTEDVGQHMRAGSIQTTDLLDVFKKITDNEITTFSKLSSIYTQGVINVDCHYWKRFVLFIGNTFLDRINFWNSRNLGGQLLHHPNSILVDEKKFEDEKFLEVLGHYLSRHNQFGSNGQKTVDVKSFSLSKERVESIREKIKKFSDQYIEVNAEFNHFRYPRTEEFYFGRHNYSEVVEIDISESTTLEVKPPYHTKFTPLRRESLSFGQWMIDVEMSRGTTLTNYENVIDSWHIPKKVGASAALTKNLSRTNSQSTLSIIPTTESFGMISENATPIKYKIQLRNQSEIGFFRYLVISGRLDPSDLRTNLNTNHYIDMRISDKGQNLRGIISMFSNFSEAYEILTKKVWRDILRANYEKESISFEELFGFLPNNYPFKKMIQSHYHFGGIHQSTKFLQSIFLDTLEYLVKKKIFFQVHKWRCAYCGHHNIVSIDEIKKLNNCTVCTLEYYAPIRFDWVFKINHFVGETLCKRHELPVLWAAGFLFKNAHSKSFLYLPEVNLYINDQKKEEIDLLCVLEGEFVAVEVKKTAFQFTNKPDEVTKFIDKIIRISPDRALIMCESYIDEESQTELSAEYVKKDFERICETIKNKLSENNIGFAYVIASAMTEFNEQGPELGYEGKRFRAIMFDGKN